MMTSRWMKIITLLLLFSGEMVSLQGVSLRAMMASTGSQMGDLPFSIGQHQAIYTLRSLKYPGARYNLLIHQVARKYHMEPELVKAVIEVESDFDPLGISPVGAVGLMQLMPETAALLKVHNLLDPQENIRGGTMFLGYLLKTYKGNLRLTLAAYNAGPKSVEKYRGIPPFKETQEFVDKVLSRYYYYRYSSPDNLS